ncbi:MAG TPA: GAF domain-containing sensor histidine kinase [Candidatus Limnocylindria bacterium]|nr:GAF domain-containing sensor histidine kinase [Candidatus Limnocylindria bacterium]
MTGPPQAEQLALLLSLQRELALETDIDVVLHRIADFAVAILDAERATVYVVDRERSEVWSRVLTASELREIRLPLDGRGLASEVARGGGVLRIDDPYGDPRFDASVDARSGFRTRSMLVAPIDARDRTRLGVLQVVNKKGDQPFSKEDEDVSRSLASSAGIALEYVALNQQLAQERLRVVKVTEETRHRLARDLHDGVAQTLANAAIGIELAQRRAKIDVDAAIGELDKLRERLLDAQQGLRDILFALRPVALTEDGLAAAVRALAERMDGTNESRVFARQVSATSRLAPEVEAGAFTVLREAANNAVKTGRAPNVALDVTEDANAIVGLVEDDGAGFDVAATLGSYAGRGSLGLLQMREAARLIGAQLTIDSSPGNGTRVRLRIPKPAVVR